MIETQIVGKIPDLDKELRKPLGRAVRKAISSAIRDMRSAASKGVRERKMIKAKAVRGALRLRFAKGRSLNNMEGALEVSNEFARVADYPHRQNKRGVSVTINRGKRSQIDGAFKASMKSGHKGVFVRAPADQGVPVDNPRGRYAGSRRVQRLPIQERLASRVIDAVQHRQVLERVQERGQESFQKTLERVLPLEIEKAKAKKGTP